MGRKYVFSFNRGIKPLDIVVFIAANVIVGGFVWSVVLFL